MSERLQEILKNRGMQCDIWEKMNADKIDEDAIVEMTDEELKEYIPQKGDRIVVKAFACKEKKETQSDKRKLSLLENLRAKMTTKSSKTKTKNSSSDNDFEVSNSSPGSSDASAPITSTSKTEGVRRKIPAARQTRDLDNTNKIKQSQIASKSVRSALVGFCIYEKNGTEYRYRQVRAPLGGGVRNISIKKTTTKSELLHKIKPLFFPDGKNCHGAVEDFDLDVSTDVHGVQVIHKNETVQELIDRLCLKHLRCYLLAKEVVLDEDNSIISLEDSLEDLPDMFPNKHGERKGIMPSRADTNRVEDAQEMQVSSHGSDNDEVLMVSHEDVATTVEEHYTHQGVLQSEYGAFYNLVQGDQMKSDSDFIIAQNVECPSSTKQGLPNVEYNVPVGHDIQSADGINAISGSLPQAYNIPDEFIQEDTLARMNGSDTVQFGPFIAGDPDLNATQPAVKEIKVHRGNVCSELIDYFSEEENIDLTGTTFEVKMLRSNGTTELAEDNGGVMRDCLTEFYDSFYLQYATGNSVAVPVLRHDMTGNHWSAVAEVIRVGFRQEGIFPVKVALPFMQQALFGLSDDPLDAFLQIIPDIDRLLLQDAIKSVSSVDQDELFDFMDRHEAKQNPTDANIRKVLTEMAHKEIVQTPLFVAECWRPKLNTLGLSQHQLRKIYANLIPDTKKVLKILEFPESMGTDERTLSSSIKRLVREMDSSLLGLFLRFCTGSNLMVRNKISVRFNNSVVCCPTSHTCGSVLEVPRSYAGQPFITFKSEFTTLLNNRYWQMDII